MRDAAFSCAGISEVEAELLFEGVQPRDASIGEGGVPRVTSCGLGCQPGELFQDSDESSLA